MTKEKYIHFGLLAVALVLVLWYLTKQAKPSATSEAVNPSVPNPAGADNYPGAPAPIKLGDVNISVPPYITYNQGLTSGRITGAAEISDGPNSCCDGCGAGGFVNKPTVPDDVYQGAVQQFQSFLSKMAA
jgi:hypothetical protein